MTICQSSVPNWQPATEWHDLTRREPRFVKTPTRRQNDFLRHEIRATLEGLTSGPERDSLKKFPSEGTEREEMLSNGEPKLSVDLAKPSSQ